MSDVSALARRRALRVGVPVALAAVIALYLLVLWPWMIAWGTTSAERDGPLPGDELVVGATDQSTRAIAVHAPAYVTWQWLVQLGQDRGGFYSYDWLENLLGASIHNADRIHPEWQSLHTGDLVRAIPPGYFGDRVQPPGWYVASMSPGRWFVLERWGVFLVAPTSDSTSRLVVRTRFRDTTTWGPVITRLGFGPTHFVMERQMLRGIAMRAEGRDRSHALDLLASLGFALAAVGVTRAFLARRRRWPWLALVALLSAWVWRATGDAIAATAGFTALGLTLLGLAQLRRAWALLLPIPALVLLVLLFAPDAFVAFGLGFLLLGSGWLALILRDRPRPVAAPRLAHA
jgi:hypothetical protein